MTVLLSTLYLPSPLSFNIGITYVKINNMNILLKQLFKPMLI